MSEEVLDVKNEAVQEPVEPNSESSSEVHQDQEPAEALKTEDSIPDSVPYSRFKEKVDEYNTIKERYESYQKFEEYLESNPDKAKAIEELLTSQRQNVDPLETVTQRLERIERANMAMEAEKRVMSYKEEFRELAKKAEISKERMPLVEEFTELKLIQMAQGDPIRNFDVKTLHKAFDSVIKGLDGVLKADKTKYINSKTSNEMPVNKGGSAPREAPKELETREDRNRAILEELMASQR